ncbi:TetR/AcrR family transcriptional regulator [Companilactobacillus suantsaicola]|uniref:TetR/AcrR family transcriptional regulator n=1 Tax=Companilactobacillus suantsaicola TaxID=2487723 RepID=A0A4Z0JI75_9LACO|nr:TetR/AcrR family transcriptional regulator [Companilactobacillus suantsaicola]TGD22711.1 TetR/AcrR family transcriptional regulator [Companilactobacillus suantsaicola]
MTARTLSKEKVITAAIQIINQEDNLTFSKLGRLVGTRSQAIYNYFPDVLAVRVSVAADFYDKLAQRLEVDLLGLTGKQAIKAFCHVCVQFSLGQYVMVQQIIDIPADHLHDEPLNSSFRNIYEILHRYLKPLIPDEKRQMVFSRMLRNLIIGQIINVGSGRYTNTPISKRDSFDDMLELILLSL